MTQLVTIDQVHELLGRIVNEAEPWLVARGIVAPSTGQPAVSSTVTNWQLVREEHGVDYKWPDSTSHYDPLRTYSNGVLELGLGFAVDPNGNAYVQILKDGVPFSSFQAAADFATSNELVAVIRGRGGGRKMFSITDPLPPECAHMRIERLIDRIPAHRFRNAVCVVVNADDDVSMLNHGKTQVELRGL